MKNYFLVLLSVMGVGILFNHISPAEKPIPDTAVSSEMLQVEEIPTLSKITEISADSIQDISSTAQITTTTTAYKTSYTHVAASIPTYHVTIHSDSVKSRDLSYNDIYKTNKLIYGHNSSNLLGSLKSLSIGSTFNVVEGGITTTYQVADSRVFHKSDNYTLELCKSGYDNCNGGVYYLNSLQYATFMGQNYDIAIFTCDGTSLGGGDATHRRVVFAYKI